MQDDALQDINTSINLQIDATFFGREFGFLVFHDCQKVIYFKEIKTESIKDFKEGIKAIKQANIGINSITIDGKRGYINNIKKLLGNIPIQMCLFHQKAIIRRYIANNPQSSCGKDLKELMHLLCKPEFHQEFIDRFYFLKEKYYFYLQQRNELGDYKFKNLRSSFRSIETNLPLLFTYSDFENLKIPSTNNQLEGLFSHIKERIKMHRGLDKNRKKKAVKFLLKNLGKKQVSITPFF
ncbi:MAG: hypothetical protein ACKO46_01050 [Alphaproteobacteria bacterium]